MKSGKRMVSPFVATHIRIAQDEQEDVGGYYRMGIRTDEKKGSVR